MDVISSWYNDVDVTLCLPREVRKHCSSLQRPVVERLGHQFSAWQTLTSELSSQALCCWLFNIFIPLSLKLTIDWSCSRKRPVYPTNSAVKGLLKSVEWEMGNQGRYGFEGREDVAGKMKSRNRHWTLKANQIFFYVQISAN